jgi:Domain of unknown function (DUF5615)
LTQGVNLKFLAEYCGTSMAMIERRYDRFLADGRDYQLGLLAATLRQRGFDARHVIELKRDGLSDPEQLAFAAKQRRAILTHNVRETTYFWIANTAPRERPTMAS